MVRVGCSVGGVALAATLFSGAASADPSLQTIHQFQQDKKGCVFNAGLTAGTHGEYYGATSLCGGAANSGTIFMLTPPAHDGQSWKLTTLWHMRTKDGQAVTAQLLLGSDGALYGTTYKGATAEVAGGTVFRLAPSAQGATKWTFERLISFSGRKNDLLGEQPATPLIQDEMGALYGATSTGGFNNGGSLFKLVPPAGGTASPGPWHAEHICTLARHENEGGGPWGPLYRDGNGVLYGTSLFLGRDGRGTVFSATPPAQGKTAWSCRALAALPSPNDDAFGGLVAGADNALYGTSSGFGNSTPGTVFRVLPPKKTGGHWKVETIYVFQGSDGAQPEGQLLADGQGGFYGTTIGGGTGGEGTVFHLVPSANGTLPWTLTTLYDFSYGFGQPYPVEPLGNLLLDPSGALLGVASQDTEYFAGAVFRLTP